MGIRKLLQIISLGILGYLFLSSTKHIDIASTKNDYLIASRKLEIDTIADINKVKNEAKNNLDTIRKIHKAHSSDSKTQVFLITFLIIIQITLFTKK